MQVIQNRDLLHLITGPVEMESKVEKMSKVSSLFFMLKKSIMWVRMIWLEHSYKECNAKWQSGRKYVRECKIMWQEWWDQNHLAIWMADHCIDYAHKLTCSIDVVRFFTQLLAFLVHHCFNWVSWYYRFIAAILLLIYSINRDARCK